MNIKFNKFNPVDKIGDQSLYSFSDFKKLYNKYCVTKPRYAIITPTYRAHFQFIKKYLQSFEKFVIDKENVVLLFTISRDEAGDFKKITDKYCKNINFETIFFEDVLSCFDINYSPVELLKKYGRFTFQTLKKFYTMLCADFDKFLVLDSESMWVKKTNIKNLFEDFFESPFISGSSIYTRNIKENCFRVLLIIQISY